MFVMIGSFVVYFLILFVVSYIVVEYGQNYFYDEVTAGAPAKVAIGALLLALMMTWTKSNLATMFTEQIQWTVLLAILWTGVFILIYQFQPWHGFGLAMATLLIFAGMSTIVVDSLFSPKPAGRMDITIENKPIRRPAYGNQPPPKPAVEPKK